ncbi:PREDICTED: F-box/LRR-repeat protein 16-like [Priapulus caudatus]|uniref:F-box/LRR-repeat protein 16-like n=1 Tax=Priapulus caudatus TaxID=37621 RepID=A0ABM1EEJ2_PRICU|nr:PREDICTED: F-box/LRR-repeat protein 16-like [Priapulus caudatus]
MATSGGAKATLSELVKGFNGLGMRNHRGRVSKESKEQKERMNSMAAAAAAAAAAAQTSPTSPPPVTSPTPVVTSPSITKTSPIGAVAIGAFSYNCGDEERRNIWLNGEFLVRFFEYFGAYERCLLAQVCAKWRDIIYQPRFWTGVTAVIHCKEWRQQSADARLKHYYSLQRRGFDSICFFAATDDDMDHFVENFNSAKKSVRCLSMRCSNASDRGLERILHHLPNVNRLELSGCNEITEAGLWSCLSSNIEALAIADCINVADDSVGAIAQLLPSLREFNLQAYHVTDSALSYFSAKQSYSLSVLRLTSCWEVTNHGVVNIVHALPNLTELSLSGCSKVTDDGVELIAENLRKLKSLDLSWCPRITDAALEYIACDLGELETLVLDRCMHVTDIGVGYLSTMTSLTSLFLRWCCQLRDFGLQHLYSMRNLQVLSLAV